MGFNGRTNREKALFEKENHLNQSSIIGFHGNFLGDISVTPFGEYVLLSSQRVKHILNRS